MNFFPLIFEFSQFLKLSIIRSLIYVLIKYLIPVFNAYLTCESFDLYFFVFCFLRRRRKLLIDILPKSASHWRDILILSPKSMIILYKRYLHIIIIVKKNPPRVILSNLWNMYILNFYNF